MWPVCQENPKSNFGEVWDAYHKKLFNVRNVRCLVIRQKLCIVWNVRCIVNQGKLCVVKNVRRIVIQERLSNVRNVRCVCIQHRLSSARNVRCIVTQQNLSNVRNVSCIVSSNKRRFGPYLRFTGTCLAYLNPYVPGEPNISFWFNFGTDSRFLVYITECVAVLVREGELTHWTPLDTGGPVWALGPLCGSVSVRNPGPRHSETGERTEI